MHQLDLFDSPPLPPLPAAPSLSPILGLRVELPRPCPSCGSKIATIGSSCAMHGHRLDCTVCGALCRWFGRREADLLSAVSRKFGAPTSPIVLRERA
jgi:hypothetical protein